MLKEKDPQDINVKEWDEMVTRAVKQRSYLEQQWYTNLSFYKGNQWATWVKNPIAEQGVSFKTPKSNRKRLVRNKIRSRIRWEFTKLIKEEPQTFIKPNTSDQSDVAAAKTGEALSEFLAVTRNFNRARRKATWWACQTGVGFIKTEYDQTIPVPGPVVIDEETGQEVPANPEGNIHWSGVSPFHLVVPYLDREDLEEQPWCVHLRTVEPDVVEATYGKKLEPDSKATGAVLDGRFLQSINVRKSEEGFDQVYVKELWMKPCAKYPGGLFAVWGNEQLLYASEHPYKHKELPFAKIGHIPSGGFYPYSTIEDLVSLQKEYNLTNSQLAESRDLTSKPALVAEKGTDVKQLKAVPGQVITVNPGAEYPRRLINPEMPGYIMQILEGILGDMDDASGQYETAQGKTPPGVEAASAIAYLQEENNTRLYHTIASLEEAVATAGKQALMLIQQYWTATRIINTVSSAHMQGSIEFKSKDLKNNTDLRVVAGSMAPRSAAAKQASIMELFSMQAIGPDQVLKHLGLAETNLIVNEMFVDEQQAVRENLRLARGEQVIVNDWDEHEIHITVLNNFRKTQEFEMLPDEIKKLFQAHHELHVAAATQTLEQSEGLEDDGSMDPELGGEPTDGDESGGELPALDGISV